MSILILQIYCLALKVVIIAAGIEIVRLRRSNKFYRSYISRKNVELSTVQQQIADIEKKVEDITSSKP